MQEGGEDGDRKAAALKLIERKLSNMLHSCIFVQFLTENHFEVTKDPTEISKWFEEYYNKNTQTITSLKLLGAEYDSSQFAQH